MKMAAGTAVVTNLTGCSSLSAGRVSAGHWQEAVLPHLGDSSIGAECPCNVHPPTGLLDCPHNMAAGLPHSEWSKTE